MKFTKVFISILGLSAISQLSIFGMFKMSTNRLFMNKFQTNISGAFKGTRINLFKATMPKFMTRDEALTTFGIKDGATESEIKSAYRKAVLASHPDSGGSNEKMKIVNQARDVLSNKEVSENETGGSDFTCEGLGEIFKKFHEEIEKILYGCPTDFHKFIRKGDLYEVENLLKSGVSANYDISYRVTPLIEAIETSKNYDNTEVDKMVQLLLRYGADPNGECIKGSNPLFSAIYNGNIKVVRTLLKAGANVNKGGKLYGIASVSDNTPLMIAFDRFILSIKTGNKQQNKRFVDIIKVLLSYGANPNYLDEYGRPQLINIAFYCYYYPGYVKQFVEIARALIEAGAIVTIQKNDDGNTALHFATKCVNADMVHLLVNADSKIINMQNNYGDTALHFLMNEFDDDPTESLIYLLKVGADLLIKNKKGFLPIQLMIERAQMLVASYKNFIEKGPICEQPEEQQPYERACQQRYERDEQVYRNIFNILNDATLQVAKNSNSIVWDQVKADDELNAFNNELDKIKDFNKNAGQIYKEAKARKQEQKKKDEEVRKKREQELKAEKEEAERIKQDEINKKQLEEQWSKVKLQQEQERKDVELKNSKKSLLVLDQKEEQNEKSKNRFIKGAIAAGVVSGAAYGIAKYISSTKPTLQIEKNWFGTKPWSSTVWNEIEKQTNNAINRQDYTYELIDDGQYWKVVFTKK